MTVRAAITPEKYATTESERTQHSFSNIVHYTDDGWSGGNYHWLVDEEAAAVVRHIFQLTIEGHGPYEIATMLCEEKIETPAASGLTARALQIKQVTKLNTCSNRNKRLKSVTAVGGGQIEHHH